MFSEIWKKFSIIFSNFFQFFFQFFFFQNFFEFFLKVLFSRKSEFETVKWSAGNKSTWCETDWIDIVPGSLLTGAVVFWDTVRAAIALGLIGSSIGVVVGITHWPRNSPISINIVTVRVQTAICVNDLNNSSLFSFLKLSLLKLSFWIYHFWNFPLEIILFLISFSK